MTTFQDKQPQSRRALRQEERAERPLTEDLGVRDLPRLDLEARDRVLVAPDRGADRDVGGVREQGHQRTPTGS